MQEITVRDGSKPLVRNGAVVLVLAMMACRVSESPERFDATSSALSDFQPPVVHAVVIESWNPLVLRVDATDNDRITAVDFYYDEYELARRERFAPYRATINPAITPIINIIVYDRMGNSTEVSQRVAPGDVPPPDTTPPSISSNLAPGGYYTGVSTIAVSAVDDRSEVSYIRVLLDGADIGGADQSALQMLWNTIGLAEGPHIVTFLAADGEDNVAQLDVLVKVDNRPPLVYFLYPGTSAYVGIGYAPPIKATDQGGVGVARVEYYLNGVYEGTLVYHPGANTTTLEGDLSDWYPPSFPSNTPGVYSVFVRAVDAFGHEAWASDTIYMKEWHICAYGCSPECPDLCG